MGYSRAIRELMELLLRPEILSMTEQKRGTRTRISMGLGVSSSTRVLLWVKSFSLMLSESSFQEMTPRSEVSDKDHHSRT